MSARYGKDFPMVLGFDVSGVVAEVGDAKIRLVRSWAPPQDSILAPEMST